MLKIPHINTYYKKQIINLILFTCVGFALYGALQKQLWPNAIIDAILICCIYTNIATEKNHETHI
ncbi:MAG: hypothetical protein Q7K40_03115 [bacterium]|nr:hypothetical protein [bacterium]